MTYYVYKAKGKYPVAWELFSQHDTIEDAEAAAEKCCPTHSEINTEPGNKGLKRAYFGSASSKLWSAMITTEPSPERS